MAAEIAAANADGSEGAAIAIDAEALDRGPPGSRYRSLEATLRRLAIARGAAAPMPAVASELGRIDAEEADALLSATQGVPVDHDELAGEQDGLEEHPAR